MNDLQKKDIFNEWAFYGPYEQRLMIDEYLRVSKGNCSEDRFLNFLQDKLQSKTFKKTRKKATA